MPARPDRARHKASIKNTRVSVVKTTLQSFCRPVATALPWQALILKLNTVALEAYMLANLHVLTLVDQRKPLPVLDQNFWYRCCSLVSCPSQASRKTKFPDGELMSTSARYSALRPFDGQPVCSDHLGAGLFNNLSQQMDTNMKNHASLNFYTRFRRYLRLSCDFDGPQAYSFLKDVYASDYTGSNPLVSRYRRLLPITPTEKNIAKDPRIVLPVLHEIQRFYDRLPLLQGTSRFTLLPLKQGFTLSAVKLCSTSLRALIKLAGRECQLKVPGVPEFLREADGFWRELFHIDHLETANRKFVNEIVTDGKSVSVVMRRPCPPVVKSGAKRKMEQVVDYKLSWGLDPGMRDMFVASSSDDQTIRCSSKEFYDAAHYTSSNKKIRTWVDKRPDISSLTALLPSARTGRVTGLTEHVGYVLRYKQTLFDFYGARRFQNLKLRRYIHAAKKLRALCKRLAGSDGQSTVVGFGDWSLQTAAGVVKRCKPGPSGRLRRQLHKYCKVVDVDEYLTSKTCHECHSRLENMLETYTDAETGRRRSRKVHAVQHCQNSDCSCTTVNRDVNASRNILHLLMREVEKKERPVCFTRRRLS